MYFVLCEFHGDRIPTRHSHNACMGCCKPCHLQASSKSALSVQYVSLFLSDTLASVLCIRCGLSTFLFLPRPKSASSLNPRPPILTDSLDFCFSLPLSMLCSIWVKVQPHMLQNPITGFRRRLTCMFIECRVCVHTHLHQEVDAPGSGS